MGNYYDLGRDFGIAADVNGNYPDDTYVSVSPHWVLAVVRYKHVVTYNRTTKTSYSRDGAEAVAEAGPPLIITSDCISVTTTHTKGNHVNNLSATLMGAGTNYLSEILTGDWVFCWMVNSGEKASDLVSRIQQGKPCNDSDDGLKFIGTVSNLTKDLTLDHSSGRAVVRYRLSASGFTALDSQIFFEPLLRQDSDDVASWMAKVFGDIKKILLNQNTSTGDLGGIDINLAIPRFIEVLLGAGLPDTLTSPASIAGNLANAAAAQIGFGSNTGGKDDSAPYAYVVPATVGKLLNKTNPGKPSGVLAYSDLLDATYGLQRYRAFVTPRSPRIEDVFTPDMDATEKSKPQRKTKHDMLGIFLADPVSFDGRTVWDILNQFLNPAINEMYTAMRVNPSGRIMPTLVVRQLPFSSALMGDSDEISPFLELPRWKCPPGILYQMSVGRADALRTNYVHLTGTSIASASVISIDGYLRAPALHDDQDARRSGLHMERAQVACSIKDTIVGPRKWMELRSDMVMGQHLTLTGQVVLQGIQAPIAVGDNFDCGDGAVYHIESVAHSCSIDPSGHRSFHTVLTVTHGMNANPDLSLTGEARDASIYVGVNRSDLTRYNPSSTVVNDQPIITSRTKS